MIAALNDVEFRSLQSIDQPMLASDAARPTSRKVVLKGFGFTQAGKRARLNIFNQRIDFVADAAV